MNFPRFLLRAKKVGDILVYRVKSNFLFTIRLLLPTMPSPPSKDLPRGFCTLPAIESMGMEEEGEVETQDILKSKFCFASLPHQLRFCTKWRSSVCTPPELWSRVRGLFSKLYCFRWGRVILILTKFEILISTWFQVVPFGV